MSDPHRPNEELLIELGKAFAESKRQPGMSADVMLGAAVYAAALRGQDLWAEGRRADLEI